MLSPNELNYSSGEKVDKLISRVLTRAISVPGSNFRGAGQSPMNQGPEFEFIETTEQLVRFCDEIRGSATIAFDTEFVSEDCYQPELCLMQVAAGGKLAIIDTLAMKSSLPFWEFLVSGDHQTVVHAAREEFRFCQQYTGQRPSRLVDTQVAAGLIGIEYPAALSTLANKLLGEKIPKGETRTNWRKRPLNKNQLEYAINDVVHLPAIHAAIIKRITKLKRSQWLDEEMDRQQTELENQESGERWRRISGIASFSSKELAIVRELWQWRETEAERRNSPARRVLRDDLLVELAKRGNVNIKRIRSLRGMEHTKFKKYLPEISRVIERGANLPKNRRPERSAALRIPNLGLLGQFLATGLGVICREASLAPSLAGSSQQLRTLAAWKLGLIELSEPPTLVTGWRREVIGDEIDRLLSGKRTIRVRNPADDQPLVIEDAKD